MIELGNRRVWQRLNEAWLHQRGTDWREQELNEFDGYTWKWKIQCQHVDRDSNAVYRDEKLSGIGYASLPCGIISSTLQRLAVLFASSENITETKSDDFSV